MLSYTEDLSEMTVLDNRPLLKVPPFALKIHSQTNFLSLTP